MTLSETGWRQFPGQCPQCGKAAGLPVSVQSKTSVEVIVTMRCQQCRHEWLVHRETPMMPAIIPDRREDDIGKE